MIKRTAKFLFSVACSISFVEKWLVGFAGNYFAKEFVRHSDFDNAICLNCCAVFPTRSERADNGYCPECGQDFSDYSDRAAWLKMDKDEEMKLRRHFQASTSRAIFENVRYTVCLCRQKVRIALDVRRIVKENRRIDKIKATPTVYVDSLGVTWNLQYGSLSTADDCDQERRESVAWRALAFKGDPHEYGIERFWQEVVEGKSTCERGKPW